MRTNWHTPVSHNAAHVGLYALLYGTSLWVLFSGEQKHWWDYLLAYAAIAVATFTPVIRYALHARHGNIPARDARTTREERRRTV